MSLDQINQLTPQRWQQIKAVLCDALEREEEAERDAFLTRACGNDFALRREVESFLEPSADHVEAFADNLRTTLGRRIWSEPLGHRLGAYRIVSEIGRGGMGSVYLAERADGSFEKQVAIKLLKRGSDTDDIVRRFRAERQILAQLEHPGIAHLLDAGTTEDGLPYFVMDYVAGVPITQFVQANQLSIPQRLELFLKVCAAVERAHRDHIVHRDLKPSNILVNSEAEPKLLDFGIAKLLEPGGGSLEVTATNQRRLTPTCASPEQARGAQVTIATDVYALGALLYEILTGKSPYKFSSPHPSAEELTRVICEDEPAPPSLVVSEPEAQRALHGDLDNIIHCALRKEPEKRYSSVNDFAEDVRRYLTARPIAARPPTVTYLTRRTKRRMGIALAGSAMLVTAGALFFVLAKLRHPAAMAVTESQENLPISNKSIAVLPFDSFSAEKDSSYFVDGVQDDILTDLAKVSSLKVISRDAVLSFRGPAKKSPREIGRVLGVAHILEGTVQKSGGHVRVNARLIDTRTNAQEWAEAYERKEYDLFALQSELAQAIVGQLEARLSPTEKAAIERPPTQDMEAYDLYLQARSLVSGFTNDGKPWKKAIELTDAAIVRDPTFTLAYCLKSTAQILLYRYNDHSAERLAQAKAAADKALELAPNLPDSHLALARYYYNGFRDYARTQQELDLIDPTLRGKIEYLDMAALTERRLGHWKQAVSDGEKAVALNPRDPILVTVLVETYLALRDYPRANRVIDNAIAQFPPASTSHLWSQKIDAALSAGEIDRAQAAIASMPRESQSQDYWLATIAIYKRDYPEATRYIEQAISSEPSDPTLRLIEGQAQALAGNAGKSQGAFTKAKELLETQLRERPNDPLLTGYLATAYAGLGQSDAATSIAQRAMNAFPISHDSIEGANCINLAAQTYAAEGNAEAALQELATGTAMPQGPTYGDLRFNPLWDQLRKDPRFADILRQSQTPPVTN